MPTLIPTADTGARARPVDLTHVDPARLMPPTEHEAFLDGTGLNGPFVADLLSDMTAHERGGAALYRSVAGRTHNPVLKQRYTHFGNQTVEHVEVLETLVGRLGGDPGYVSPAARATEKAGLVPRRVDVPARRLGRPDDPGARHARRRAAGRGQGPRQLVGPLAARAEFPEGDVRDAVQEAVDRVEPEEDEHLGWAQDMRSKLISAQVRSGAAQTVTAKAEEMVARIQGLFS